MDRRQTSGAGTGSKPAGGLYLIATPIGNLGDITLRALETLREVDVVACEDTRTTGRLMSLLGLSRPLTPYHDHNADAAAPALLARLAAGESVALVSDAGMPLISDPGYRLVRAVAAAGLPVTALPGPSAALAALVLSGLPTDRFLFAGFLPSKESARRTALLELKDVPATLVLFEAPHRLPASLADMAAVLGPRPAAMARELTKLHEEVRRGTLAELAAHYAAAGPPKGEVVVVIGAPEPAPADAPADADDLDARLAEALARTSLRDAVALVAELTGRPRKQVYARAIALSGKDGGG